MLNRIFISVCLLALFIATPLCAAAGNSEGKDKADKEIKSQAKKLKKEGWHPLSGANSIEQQLMDSQQYSTTDDPEHDSLGSRYIVESGTAVGNDLNMTRYMARSQAMAMLAGMIESEINSYIETKIESRGADGLESQYHAENVVSTQGLMTSDVITVLEIYRVCKDGNYEVLINLAYDKSLLNR